MALADALRTFRYISLWGKPVISVARGLNGLIKSIFRAGEQGFAYDPNDLTTLYQDAAGTVPVTAVGQPVGLILDKSKWLRAGENLVPQKSFAGGTAGWSLQSGWTFSGGKVICNGSTSLLLSNTKFGLGKRYHITIAATRTSASGTLSIRNGSTSASEIATIQATGFEVIERSVHVSDTNTPHIYFLSQGWVGEIISISIKEIVGNHAYQTVSASRPILQCNATTGAYYLEFDGIDDFLQTNNIDFTSTDKVSVFAGVRKLSDAQRGMIAELSASVGSYNGTFSIEGNDGGARKYFQQSKGSLLSIAGTSDVIFSAPSNAVLTSKLNINTDTNELIVNGLYRYTSTQDQGTGNYGNYPLYIGRRGGATLPFNGHLYSLIGVGRLTTANETAAIEKELAKRTGVTLSV